MGDDVLCNNVRYLQSGVTAHEVHETYDQWAASYDKDNVVMEYGGPRIAARKLSRLLQDKAQPILDVACGTGWVGKEVRRLDYNIIDGVDISEKSISIARDTMVYRDLKLCDINAGGLPYEDNSYGAIISVGSFMPNHLNQAVFPEFCRVTKPGGFVVVCMREAFVYQAEDFWDGQLDLAAVKLAQEGKWLYLGRERVPNHLKDFHGLLLSFQVC